MWNNQCMPFKMAGLHYYNDFFGRVNYVALAKQGDNALDSVRQSVFSCLNCLTYDLDFWYGSRP